MKTIEERIDNWSPMVGDPVTRDLLREAAEELRRLRGQLGLFALAAMADPCQGCVIDEYKHECGRMALLAEAKESMKP